MTGTPLEYRAAPSRLPHSGAGVASLVIGAFAVAGRFVSMVSSSAAFVRSSHARSIESFILLAILASPVVGLVFGIVGMRSNHRRRVTAVIGVCLNSLVLLLLVTLIALTAVL